MNVQTAAKIAEMVRLADTLFFDGFRMHASETLPGEYRVTTPAQETETGCYYDTFYVLCGEKVGYTCTCPNFETYSTCEHLLAVYHELMRDEAMEAEWQKTQDAENELTGCDAWAEW